MAYTREQREGLAPSEADVDVSESLAGLHPEFKEGIIGKASSDIERSGIRKGDPRHGDILDLELALRLSQVNEDYPGWQQSIRNLRIAQVQSKWGSEAPKMLQALGLSYRDAPQQASKEEIMIRYLAAKKKAAQEQEKEKYQRGYAQELLDIKRGQASSVAEEKKLKKKHKGIDSQIYSRLKTIGSAIEKIDDKLQYEHSNVLATDRRDLERERGKFHETLRIEDPDDKLKKMREYIKAFSEFKAQKGIERSKRRR